MQQIVECVPNISEGRDRKLVEEITSVLRDAPGVKLLSVEPDGDYNRSVITFVGEPEAVVDAAVSLTRKATSHIDMRSHKGEHPRLGAVDVVPFVPVSGISMDDCVKLSRTFAERVGSELGIPVYLYEASATSPARRNLANVRKGEYEGLKARLVDPEWKPDFGPAEFNEKSGATVTGARKFLIAYNVNLDTPDSGVAQEIALRIRESGRPKKDAGGKAVKDEEGKTIRIPGTLKAVKAMGVFLERFNIAQVSINLVDFETTPPHVAFEEVAAQAQSLGHRATGSEIVGLIPLQALLAAGRYYAEKSRDSGSQAENHLVRRAVEELGLSQLEPFDPKKKIIEYLL